MNVPRVTLHDGLGNRLAQLTTVRSVNRAWTLLAPSSGSVTLSTVDPAIAMCDPRLGRAVVIESTEYPIPWVGAITRLDESPRDGTITLSLLSLDAILRDRLLSSTSAYTGSAGRVFTRILTDVEASNPTGIKLAASIAEGPSYATSTPDRTAYGALNALCAQTGMEWWVDYECSAQAITARAALQFARGFDRYETARLVDGGNCERVGSAIDLGGSIWALRTVAGQASVTQAYTERSRVTRQQSSAFIGSGTRVISGPAQVHGYEIERTNLTGSPLTRRESLAVAENLKALDAITAASDVLLGRPRNAERVLRLRAYPEITGTTNWSKYDIGSIVRFSSESAWLTGYDGPVRIIGVQPMEERGDIELVCQVVRART